MIFAAKKMRRSQRRSGTTAVEMAMIMPVFFLMLFAIVEFGHAMMIRSLMISTAKDAARMAAVGEMTTQSIVEYIDSRLNKAMDSEVATIWVKNASLFDDPNNDTEAVEIDDLPDIELSTAESRQLFIIRISVPYEGVALLPPFWTTGLTITGDSVIRHE